MNRKIYATALAAVLMAGTLLAQDTAREETLVLDVRQSSSLTVNHKAYSAIQFSGTVTDSVAVAAIDISGKTGTIGFKMSLSDEAFFAEQAITITDGAAGQWTATLPASSWATNILVKTRLYGDLRLSDFGNVLPSVDLWLSPSANAGNESNYVAPTSAGFETNSVLIPDLNRISFDSGITATVEQSGATNRLRLSVSGGSGTNTLAEVLSAGNDAGGSAITNVGTIEASAATIAPGGHLLLKMDDAAGTDSSLVEWTSGETADVNGNWRLHVVASNLVVQVRVSGTWTNAIQFLRP
jgi:hypothetical protein